MKGDLFDRLKQVAAKFPARVDAALFLEGQLVMTESKRRCPVAADGGQLRATGMVANPVRDGRTVTVTLSYNGPQALAVHETPSEHDPPSWHTMYENGKMIQWTSEGTGPKFLEGPLNEVAPALAGRIADRISLEKQQ